jgi:hypothetical protein
VTAITRSFYSAFYRIQAPIATSRSAVQPPASGFDYPPSSASKPFPSRTYARYIIKATYDSGVPHRWCCIWNPRRSSVIFAGGTSAFAPSLCPSRLRACTPGPKDCSDVAFMHTYYLPLNSHWIFTMRDRAPSCHDSGVRRIRLVLALGSSRDRQHTRCMASRYFLGYFIDHMEHCPILLLSNMSLYQWYGPYTMHYRTNLHSPMSGDANKDEL